ncbi:MAG TPA: hypothetical protein VF637_06700 [Sphingomicrobium sp.]|jgi:hypothetical protein
MPIFYFHIALHDRFISDPEGVERTDLAAARVEAIASARDLMRSDILGGELHMDQAIHIHDADDVHLATVTFDDALQIFPSAQRLA